MKQSVLFLQAKLRSIVIRSDTLECFKMHAMRTLRNPDVCTVRCPQLKELHLHVLPPSLAAIGVSFGFLPCYLPEQ
jgi:hypothetical protein